MVKTVPSSGNHYQIIDYRHVPFETGLDPQHLLFPQFLRNTLTRFIGAADNVSIWATVSSARLDTRLLRIPKVARRQIPNAVTWAYKRKTPFNEKDRLFDFEVLGEITETETPQIEVLAYTIPRADIDAIKAAGGMAGVHVCANTDWSLVLDSGADILSFDAYGYFDKLILYRDALQPDRYPDACTGAFYNAPGTTASFLSCI